jgi:hypothetical protein
VKSKPKPKPKPAVVLDLSASLQAVIGYTAGGLPDSLTLIRGREAFSVGGVEVTRLRDGLEPRRESQ